MNKEDKFKYDKSTKASGARSNRKSREIKGVKDALIKDRTPDGRKIKYEREPKMGCISLDETDSSNVDDNLSVEDSFSSSMDDTASPARPVVSDESLNIQGVSALYAQKKAVQYKQLQGLVDKRNESYTAYINKRNFIYGEFCEVKESLTKTLALYEQDAEFFNDIFPRHTPRPGREFGDSDINTEYLEFALNQNRDIENLPAKLLKVGLIEVDGTTKTILSSFDTQGYLDKRNPESSPPSGWFVDVTNLDDILLYSYITMRQNGVSDLEPANVILFRPAVNCFSSYYEIPTEDLDFESLKTYDNFITSIERLNTAGYQHSLYVMPIPKGESLRNYGFHAAQEDDVRECLFLETIVPEIPEIVFLFEQFILKKIKEKLN